MKSLQNLEKLVIFALKVDNEQYGKSLTPAWVAESSWMFSRILMATLSTLKLIPKSIFHGKSECYICNATDIFTIHATCRTVVESALFFNYLFISWEDEEERKCRWNLWEYHASVKRVKWSEMVNTSLQEELKYEREFMASLWKELESNCLNKMGNPNKVREGDVPTFLNISEIGNNMGINKTYWSFLYKFLSNYAHPYPFSYFRGKEFNKEKQEDELAIPVQILLIFLSIAMKDYFSTLSKGGVEVNMPDDINEILVIWSGLPTVMYGWEPLKWPEA